MRRLHLFRSAKAVTMPSAGILILLAAGPLLAASSNDTAPPKPTFFKDVLPILQDNCQTCHRPAGENIGGMLAPMSLMTYDQVRPWARGIARKVQERSMPPWFASSDTDGVFRHQRQLTGDQIDTLVRWAREGAERGDQADAPAPRRFAEEATQGWTNGKPDLVISLPQPHFVKDEVTDENIYFLHTLTEEQLPESRFVRGIEFKVGGPSVHHMCAFYRAPGGSRLTGGLDFSKNSLGCIALGAEPTLLPEGYGYYLEKGTTIVFSMHYHKEPGPGSGFWDQSQIGFVFNREPVYHRVRYDAVALPDFEIPPDTKRWKVGASKIYHQDSTLVALWPHAHLRGVEMLYQAFYPDGTQEQLLHVPAYDQEWQTTYLYKEPKQIPAGTRVEVTMWYDNSAERGGVRGFDSHQAVNFGEETTDEMMLGFLNYTHTEPIDFAAEPARIATAANNDAP